MLQTLFRALGQGWSEGVMNQMMIILEISMPGRAACRYIWMTHSPMSNMSQNASHHCDADRQAVM